MSASGIRRVFVAKSPDELARLRALQGKQANIVTQNLSASTLSRVERGYCVSEDAARTLHRIVAPERAFEELFDLAPDREGRSQFTWEQVSRSAAQIGTQVFRDFRPDFILTFAGPSALFTSLVMTKTLTREEFLDTTVYVALFQSKRRRAAHPGTLKGFDAIDSHRFIVQIPSEIGRDIRNRAAKRVCIIDDTVTTGSVAEHVKDHLVHKGYRNSHIRYATCVCSDVALKDEGKKPDLWSYEVKGNYRMPWGDPL